MTPLDPYRHQGSGLHTASNMPCLHHDQGWDGVVIEIIVFLLILAIVCYADILKRRTE